LTTRREPGDVRFFLDDCKNPVRDAARRGDLLWLCAEDGEVQPPVAFAAVSDEFLEMTGRTIDALRGSRQLASMRHHGTARRQNSVRARQASRRPQRNEDIGGDARIRNSLLPRIMQR
jgi:hypothetical protein